MAFTKWFAFLGLVVMLAACGGDMVIEKSFDASAEEPADDEDSSNSSDKEKSSDSKNYSSSKEASSSSSEPAEENKGKTIYGAAQKGPFLAQSVVKIYELKKKTLAKTGNVFSGEVGSDGRFEVPNVELSSPYALLEVNGRYRNEMTGEVSDNEISLYALVDLEDREEVNINLLTHLTYERILYLFGTGVDFASAKKQAESEILKAFYIEDKFENFEDMNIFGDGEEGGALLAISVLVLDYYNEEKLAKFLEVFATDFKKDGTWDDKTTRYNVGILSEYLTEDVVRIYKNIADWKIGSVPKFAKYIRGIKCGFHGWSKCYEECDVDGSIRTGSWAICLGGVWLYAENARTMDTYGWEAGEDGELRKGDSTGAFYKYDEVLKLWDNVEWYDTTLQLGCTRKREGEIALNPKDNSYYVCKHNVDDAQGFDGCFWEKAHEIDFIKRDKKCDSEDVGRIIAGIDTVTNKYYCTTEGWVNFMSWSFGIPKEFHFNPDINYGAMTDNRDGKVYRTVKIGEQTWMAENLNYAGDGIGHCYNDIPENCDVGGRLYKWDVAKEVCPEGWHLPSKKEFETLFSTVERMHDEEECSLADMFKATSGWVNFYWQHTQGLDKVGFSAVPAGGKHILSYREPEYNHSGHSAYFLSSTEYSEGRVYVMLVRDDEAAVVDDYDEGNPHYSTKESEFSVRCLKDSE